jgi:DNA modification methylase
MNDIFNDNVPLKTETPAFAKHVLPAVPSSEVYLEDCVTALKRYADNHFDLAIVDPPYGINADVTQNGLGGKKGFTKNAGTYKKYHQTNWDNEIPTDEYFAELKRVSKNQIVWGGNYFHNLHLEGVIVWYKKGSGNFKEGEFAKQVLTHLKFLDIAEQTLTLIVEM